jgi:hypothetical protein
MEEEASADLFGLFDDDEWVAPAAKPAAASSAGAPTANPLDREKGAVLAAVRGAKTVSEAIDSLRKMQAESELSLAKQCLSRHHIWVGAGAGDAFDRVVYHFLDEATVLVEKRGRRVECTYALREREDSGEGPRMEIRVPNPHADEFDAASGTVISAVFRIEGAAADVGSAVPPRMLWQGAVGLSAPLRLTNAVVLSCPTVD